MSTRLRSILKITILLCVLFPMGIRAQDPTEKKLTFVMEDFDQEIILRKLSEKAGVPIGFAALKGESLNQPFKRTSISIQNGTVRDILDAFVKADDRYKWVVSDGVINVVPKEPEEGILDVVIQNFNRSQISLKDFSVAVIDLPEVKARLETLRITPARTTFRTAKIAESPRFSISTTNVTVCDLLNEVLRNRYTNYWLVMRYGDRNEYVDIEF